MLHNTIILFLYKDIFNSNVIIFPFIVLALSYYTLYQLLCIDYFVQHFIISAIQGSNGTKHKEVHLTKGDVICHVVYPGY